jgi:hypothetical protein
MKWIIYEEDNRFTKWHRWFAWYPVEISKEKITIKVWLGFVYRRCVYHNPYKCFRRWEYEESK